MLCIFLYSGGIILADDDFSLSVDDCAILRLFKVDEHILYCILSDEMLAFHFLLQPEGLLALPNSLRIELPAYLLEISSVRPSGSLPLRWRVGDEVGIANWEGRTIGESDCLGQSACKLIVRANSFPLHY